MGAIDPSSNYGMQMSAGGFGTQASPVMAAVKKNLKDNGAQAVVTVIGAPIAAKLLKRVARKPIRDMNKMLKWSGVQSATGVKI